MISKKLVEFTGDYIDGNIGVEKGSRAIIIEHREYFTVRMIESGFILGHYDWECKEEIYGNVKELEKLGETGSCQIMTKEEEKGKCHKM